MKRYLLLAILSLIFCITGLAQSLTDKKIKKAINRLHKNGVFTIVGYYVDCVGYAHVFKLSEGCKPFDVKYLFWINDQNAFVQRFDECRDYMPVPTSDLFIRTFANNVSAISSENILWPEHDLKDSTKRVIVRTVDHSCYTVFNSYIPKNKFQKDFSEYYLDSVYVEKGYLNDNYEHNHKTYLYKLKAIAEKQVADLIKK